MTSAGRRGQAAEPRGHKAQRAGNSCQGDPEAPGRTPGSAVARAPAVGVQIGSPGLHPHRPQSAGPGEDRCPCLIWRARCGRRGAAAAPNA
jgi:hypothetical protein